MKVKVTYKVSELNQEDLVNILETATYGSEWLSITTKGENKKLYDASEFRCCSEKWADVLLKGGEVVAIDYEDDEKEYPFNLEKLTNSMNKFMAAYPHNAKEIMDDNGDYFTYNNLVQFVMFGDVVYG